MMNSMEVLAFYLPQFYPFKENDEWWGCGFTEWTNVKKACPLYPGHYQPRIPADLGYYDLRQESIREQQAQMAEDAGVTGFCYWHYWFGNGKRLLSDVFDEVLNSGHPDFRFCLGWANHSWYKKTWAMDKKSPDTLLIEQTYPGEADVRAHFEYLLNAFKDNRYVKIDGAPFLYIFDPVSVPELYISLLRAWTKEAGFPDLFLVANIQGPAVNKMDMLDKGFSAVSYNRMGDYASPLLAHMGRVGRKIDRIYKRALSWVTNRPPYVVRYSEIVSRLVTPEEREESVIPCIIPQWDHSPRSGFNALIYDGSTPGTFYKHCFNALDSVKGKKNPIVLLKSWNEWGEGNYMEPDTVFGREYIDALHNALNDIR